MGSCFSGPTAPLPKFEPKKYIGHGRFGIVIKVKDSQSFSVLKLVKNQTIENRERVEADFKTIQAQPEEFYPNIIKTVGIISKKLHPGILKDLLAPDSFSMEYNEMARKRIGGLISEAREHGHVDALLIHMELCGENLAQWVDHAEKSNCVRIQVSRGILTGVGFLHDNRILHRDLKPRNICFAKEGFQLPVKIGDFGIIPKVNDTNDVEQSHRYQPPEILSSPVTYTVQSDLYSFGLILLEIFQLVKASDRGSVFRKLVQEKHHNLVQDNPLIPNLKETIIRLTQRDKSLRPKSVQEVTFSYDLLELFKEQLDFRELLNLLSETDEFFLQANVVVFLQFLSSTSPTKSPLIYDQVCKVLLQIKEMSEFTGLIEGLVFLACSGDACFDQVHFTSVLGLGSNGAKKLFRIFTLVGLVEQPGSYYSCPSSVKREIRKWFLNKEEFLKLFGRVFKVEGSLRGVYKWALGVIRVKRIDNSLAYGCFKTIWPQVIDDEEIFLEFKPLAEVNWKRVV